MLVYKILKQCGDSPLFKVQRIGGVGSKDPRVLHRNMLYPFIGVREDVEDDTEEEVRCLPEKSLLDPRAVALRRADYFMETYFDDGAQCGAQTHDPGIKSPMLYRLS